MRHVPASLGMDSSATGSRRNFDRMYPSADALVLRQATGIQKRGSFFTTDNSDNTDGGLFSQDLQDDQEGSFSNLTILKNPVYPVKSLLPLRLCELGGRFFPMPPFASPASPRETQSAAVPAIPHSAIRAIREIRGEPSAKLQDYAH